MTGLAPIDGLAVLAILAKATGYGAALLAIGGVLFEFVFAKRAESSVLRLARHLAFSAALIGLAGSYHLDTPAGPSIVVAAISAFVLSAMCGAAFRRV